MMDRPRASSEQFLIMVDFMERNGDLSKPQPGAQGRAISDRKWTALTEVLNSLGGTGVCKQPDKWRRVWSDWKAKTKKKAAAINRDNNGTGGGPSRARPLNPLEERVLHIIGLSCITGHEEIQEAGFEVISESTPKVSLDPATGELTVEVSCTPHPELVNVATNPAASLTNRTREDTNSNYNI